MEKTILGLLATAKHIEELLAFWDFTIDETIQYSDLLKSVNAELGAVLA